MTTSSQNYEGGFPAERVKLISTVALEIIAHQVLGLINDGHRGLDDRLGRCVRPRPVLVHDRTWGEVVGTRDPYERGVEATFRIDVRQLDGDV